MRMHLTFVRYAQAKYGSDITSFVKVNELRLFVRFVYIGNIRGKSGGYYAKGKRLNLVFEFEKFLFKLLLTNYIIILI